MSVCVDIVSLKVVTTKLLHKNSLVIKRNFFDQGFDKLNNMATSKKPALVVGSSQSERNAFRFRLYGQRFYHILLSKKL